MPLPKRILLARQELEKHLEKFDWSDLTNGRKNILNAFLKLATTQGYAAVTMRELGKVLNMKAPSIYSHFAGGRDEIVSACLRWHYYNFGIAVLEAVGPTDNARDFLHAMVRVHFTRQLQLPENDLWDLLVASDKIGQFLNPDIRQEVQYWLRLCLKLYETAASELYDGNTKAKVPLVMSILDGANSWNHWNGKPAQLEELTEEALTVVDAIFKSAGLQPSDSL